MSGETIAGPYVRDACARHLRDLEEGPKRGLRWDVIAADRVLRYFHTVLRLNGGEHEGRPFDVHPSQAFILGSLFGWKRANGSRRFGLAFIEQGKGNGKTPLAAGIGLYMTAADMEPRAETYAAATDKDQAGILFRDAVAMAKQSPAIDKRVTYSGGEGREYNMAFLASGSFFRPISSESSGKGKSGFRPHCALLDEIHEHPTNAMVEFLAAGTKNRRQALIFMITNSGVDRSSVCFEYHEYGRKVAAGEVEDDSLFAYICALDEDREENGKKIAGDDPFTDPIDPELGFPKCWLKVNPLLGVTIQPSYLEDQVRKAQGMPSKESLVRRLNFCQWVDALNPWIDGDLWRACEVEKLPDLSGLPFFLSLDLSGKRDLTSAAKITPQDETLCGEVKFWTPKDTLHERELKDRAPYNTWVRGGSLNAVPGRSIDYDFVVKDLIDAGWLGDLCQGLTFDQWRIEDFQKSLSDAGIDCWIAEKDADGEWVEEGKKHPGQGLMMIRHGQGFGGGAAASSLWMPRSITATEDVILKTTLKVLKSPCLHWNVASAVTEQDATGNKKWEKRKSTGRIDGIVALSMAVGLAMSVEPDGGSIYDTRGIEYL